MVKKIAIISYTSRKEGCLSGVERFNTLLQKAIGGEIYTGTMFNLLNPLALNNHLRHNNIIDENTLCIVDGSWGLGIPENIPVISVVHGTWTEFNIRNDRGNSVNLDQQQMWNRPNTKMVAVSNSSAKYLLKHHGVKADKVILNGVDIEIFKPDINKYSNEQPVVLHCARDYNKGSHGKIDKIKELLKDKFEFKFLNTFKGNEVSFYQSADIVLQCSNYEGNSYFALEGMSCGLPIVASETGLFEDTDFGEYKVGEILPYTATAEMFAGAIEIAWAKRYKYNPREWILKNANLDKWNQQWKDFIKENYDIKI